MTYDDELLLKRKYENYGGEYVYLLVGKIPDRIVIKVMIEMKKVLKGVNFNQIFYHECFFVLVDSPYRKQLQTVQVMSLGK